MANKEKEHIGLYNWFLIVLIQVILVAIGLLLYNSLHGGSSIAPGDAITVWATVLTILFVVFSVIGIMNIDGKIKDLKADYQNIKNESYGYLHKLASNSSKVQEFFFELAKIEVDPNLSSRIIAYGHLISNSSNLEGIDVSVLFMKRGECYRLLRRYDLAKVDFDQAIAISTDENKDKAYYYLGIYYVSIKDIEKSIDCFKKAIKANPKSPFNYLNVATSYSRMKKFAEADVYFQKAVTINPEFAGYYFNKQVWMSDTIEKPNDAEFDQMMAYLDKCLQYDPSLKLAYLNKADLLFSKERYSDATICLNSIIGQQQKEDLLLLVEKRGDAYLKSKDYDRAVDDFRFVLFFNPYRVESIVKLSEAYVRMGKISDAKRFAETNLNVVLSKIQNPGYYNLTYLKESIQFLEGLKNSTGDIFLK